MGRSRRPSCCGRTIKSTTRNKKATSRSPTTEKRHNCSTKGDNEEIRKRKRLAIKDGIEKGKQKEKSRADRLSKLVNKHLSEVQTRPTRMRST
jgi:hypothetical protein